MSDFEELLARVRACPPDQKQRIFAEIRDDILIHELERGFGVRAEVILEAISRATDLTQRGVRGVIAETVFVLDIIPTLADWRDDPPVGDLSYDACMCKDNHRVRIQVKMQRRIRGEPMMQRGSYVVEVQRTRGGEREGVKTRPYRYGEFDLIAVCMQASTHDWHAFMHASASDLVPDAGDPTIIKTLQPVPSHTAKHEGIWTNDLRAALERFTGRANP